MKLKCLQYSKKFDLVHSFLNAEYYIFKFRYRFRCTSTIFLIFFFIL